MRMIAEYLEHAMQFERVQRERLTYRSTLVPAKKRGCVIAVTVSGQ
jgi:hypothetical protein